MWKTSRLTWSFLIFRIFFFAEGQPAQFETSKKKTLVYELYGLTDEEVGIVEGKENRYIGIGGNTNYRDRIQRII